MLMLLLGALAGGCSEPAAAQLQPVEFDLPPYVVKHGSGIFTGFNPVDLQTMFVVRKTRSGSFTD